jgi:transcriptional regulator with XRE-family HTH domain
VASLAGDFLRQMRKRQGVSQVELARRVGSSQPQLSAWERGIRPITVAQLAALLDALGLDLRLAAEPKPEPPPPDAFSAAMQGPRRGTDHLPTRRSRR